MLIKAIWIDNTFTRPAGRELTVVCCVPGTKGLDHNKEQVVLTVITTAVNTQRARHSPVHCGRETTAQ